jgi:hypothetical protein
MTYGYEEHGLVSKRRFFNNLFALKPLSKVDFWQFLTGSQREAPK